MGGYTIADAQFLTMFKHQVRQLMILLDETGTKTYPLSQEAHEVKHAILILLAELRFHNLLPEGVIIAPDTSESNGIQFYPTQHTSIQPEAAPFFLLTQEMLQAIIRKHFRQPEYTLSLAEDWSGAGECPFHQIRKGMNTKHDQEEIEEFRSGEGLTLPCMPLLGALVDEGVLPQGNYLISML